MLSSSLSSARAPPRPAGLASPSATRPPSVRLTRRDVSSVPPAATRVVSVRSPSGELLDILRRSSATTGTRSSAIGAAFGALLFGTVQQGIFYTGVNTDWFKVFLGAMLLIAVLFNSYIRKKVTGGR